VYSIGLVSSSTNLNWVFSWSVLGRGSYNLIKKLLVTFSSEIKLTPVKITSFSRFNAKSLKYDTPSILSDNSAMYWLVENNKEDRFSSLLIFILSSVLLGDIVSM